MENKDLTPDKDYKANVLPEITEEDIKIANEALDKALENYLEAEEELLQEYQEELTQIEEQIDFQDPFIPL
ncbi:MAG: hypothetical protein FWJ66_09235 [Caldibacillus sp.]